MLKRGFVTVATGKYYCWLAESLIMSYRLFSDTKYPMYVITDREGEKRLKKLFDGVIVMENPTYSFLDKIRVYDNTVFEETIFLDADMHITKDISFLFDAFEENGSEISCLGEFRAITDEVRPNHFGQAAVERFHLDKYIAFNGGVYYFKKSEKAQECMHFIQNELLPNYDEYELKYFGVGKKADEPLIGLAMLLRRFSPLCLIQGAVMCLVGEGMDSLSWNFKQKEASFIWYGKKVAPPMVHYATWCTYKFKYIKYNIKVKGLYKKTWKPIVGIQVFFAAIKWALSPRQLKSFFKWVGAHFTISWVKYRWSKLKERFNKN